MISRRSFLVASSAFLLACGESPVAPEVLDPWRLRISGRGPTRGTPLGTDVLTEAQRRAYIQVPPNYSRAHPAPLVIAFHGSGGRGTNWIGPGAYSELTDARGFILLAPDSLGETWDGITDEIGPDVAFVNAVLAQTFDRCAIDRTRIALLGFSDGASYALTLGLANGDAVRETVAHSPGFFVPEPRRGTPSFFISHGTSDPVLDIDAASRTIVPAIRAFGDDVTYVEFDGGHEVPDTIGVQAMDWLVQSWA